MDGIVGETVESGGVAITAGACYECLSYLGLSGELAAALAVLTAVSARMFFDYKLMRKEAKNGTHD